MEQIDFDRVIQESRRDNLGREILVRPEF